MRELNGMSDAEFNVIWNAAIDWQYLTMKAGKMARKSDLDLWLSKTFDLTISAAHDISNFIEDKFYFKTDGWHEWNAGRPEPTHFYGESGS